jgi:hypothetical protein
VFNLIVKAEQVSLCPPEFMAFPEKDEANGKGER